MSRLEHLMQECDRARDDVLTLVETPIKSGDLIERLNHSIADRWATLVLGDGRGEWDGCPHQLALSDLVEQGEVIWWRDDNLNVWYGLKGFKPDDQTGDNSPPVVSISSFLRDVANACGKPRYDEDGNDNPECDGDRMLWQEPCLGVVEIDDTLRSETCSVHIDGKMVEVIDYDFVCGAGADDPFWSVPWPGANVEEVVRNVKDYFDKLEGIIR